MDRLFMTSAELRRSYGGVDYRSPSRFLFEIDQSLLVRVYHEDTNGTMERLSAAQRNRELPSRQVTVAQDAGATGRVKETEEILSNGSKFKLKDRVIHPKYGVGRVLTIEGSGDNLKLSIAFESAGLKSFMEKYAPLEKV